jgi:hypothetical protein
MINRWDETWHRLREWTNGQSPSERLAAQILLHEGYENLDPSHPLGGKDDKKDAVCTKDGQQWIMAVYFPRGQKDFNDIKNKFLSDLEGVKANNADALAFITNQELRIAERKKLHESAENIDVELFHLERITTILDKPEMYYVRKQFLGIDFIDVSSPKIVTVYNQSAPQIQEKVRNGIKTSYRINPFTGAREILGIELDY